MTMTTRSIMDDPLQNEWIVCVQCDTEFEYAIHEQKRHAQMGYEPPRRCPACRKHKTKIMSEWERKLIKTRQKNNFRNDDQESRRRR